VTLYLLQDQIQYFKNDDPLAGIILIAGAGAILVIILIINILKYGISINTSGHGGEDKTGNANSLSKFSSWFALIRAVRPYGFNRRQKKILEYVFRSNGVTDPVHALSSPPVLDRYFKQAYKLIKQTVTDEAEAQQQLTQLFSVRNTIELVQNLQLTRGAPPKAETQRRFRRKQVALSCGFYMVRLEAGKGRKGESRMVVEARRYGGKLVDISIGGCAIQSSAVIPAGSRLKIEFEHSGNVVPIMVLGQVLRINRGSVTSTILHTKFLKVPRKAMNAINTIVFEYSED
jgi:hypothetical protein